MEAIQLPNAAEVTNLGGHKYQVVLEPLYPGYGVTIGNTMRRVLLSSMPGSAITAVKIRFVDHEFSTVPNVKEDVVQIILNLKQVRLRSRSSEPIKLSIKAKGETVVRAADIQKSDLVEVINPDQHIATLDNKGAELDMEITVEQGRGYVPVESRETERHDLGTLAVDAIFTPVKSVYYDVSNVRVGQMTNFDKLVLNIETDGSITGQEAVDIASNILVDHFKMFFNGQGQNFIPAPAKIAEEEAQVDEAGNGVSTDEEVKNTDETSVGESDLDNLTLSNRAKNALLKAGITTVNQLKSLSNEDIEGIPGLGKKTILEIMMLLGR